MMTELHTEQRKKLLIVDDVELNRAVLAEAFHEEYEILEAENGQIALDCISAEASTLAAVLLDVLMPVLDGIAVLEWMASKNLLDRIPVFILTSETLGETIDKAYELGVVDVIPKPFNPVFIRRRLSNILELYRHRRDLQLMVQHQTAKIKEQADALRYNSFTIIETLSTAIEFRNSESGEHIKRIRDLTAMLLRVLAETHPRFELTHERIQLISEAAVMHDVGKISIPDQILGKPGRLYPEEFEIIKTHTLRGCEILDSVEQLRRSEIYQYAYDICRHHHERYDGHGYPDGLIGDEISIWAQVVSLADVYDALVSERVYKKAYSHDAAVHMICSGECGVFNPHLLQVLTSCAIDIQNQLYADSPL